MCPVQLHVLCKRDRPAAKLTYKHAFIRTADHSSVSCQGAQPMWLWLTQLPPGKDHQPANSSLCLKRQKAQFCHSRAVGQSITAIAA